MRTAVLVLTFALGAPTLPSPAGAGITSQNLAGLRLRGIGPALTSGRIVDIAVDPGDTDHWVVASASGGVWKTTNHGTTWTPIFEDQGAYSIGCVTLDPNDASVVWVGTGENNAQRSVGYGDGVYKSTDGGDTWRRTGLEASEHIGRIVVDPRDSRRVFVAAQGPLWAPGGDRGLYRTTDGGASWDAVLTISEDTGVSDLVLHPENPDVMFAASYQRRRHVWTVINGGPESGIHKSTDGGESWTELEQGLPEDDMGRIGLAIPPAAPDLLYAIVEALDPEEAGFYLSADGGASWTRRSGYVSGSGQYYQELFPDPKDPKRIYAVDTYMQVTIDGGKTFEDVPTANKHVDEHVLWIDPESPKHLITGNDGGIYESWDRAATWRFVANLPVTQFYKIAVDDDEPFYNVFGGTQDNYTLAGPSRTLERHGIRNAHWWVVTGGDGFEPQVEPGNPDVVYAQSQYGVLVRHDRPSGEILAIQPHPEPGEILRWNWDSALIISPHDPHRLYFGANKLFRSDDRGESWTRVSEDLTRQVDRNALPVMGRVWSVDSVAKNRSTSFYGTIVALAESPLVEGLLYAGTDDGLVQVSEDGGGTWRRVESFPGVPQWTYVNTLRASVHDPDTVFAAFNNHKRGDFRPYLLVSTDRGRSWRSIAGDLPARGSSYAIAQDHEEPALLFAGTELGLFATLDGGGHWIELGEARDEDDAVSFPTVAVRDLEIQRRENDLVAGTFGRGFYVLDDYTPLRELARQPGLLEAEAALFPVKRAWLFVESSPVGRPSFQGDAYFAAPNPPFGALFTYHLRDELRTLAETRRDEERALEAQGESTPYPPWERLRAEDREEPPTVVLTVRTPEGEVVRRVHGPLEAGFHRVAWDLRYPPPEPASTTPVEVGMFSDPPMGPFVVPGTYTVELAKRVGGELVSLAEPRAFEVEALPVAPLAAADRADLLAFQQKVGRLYRAVKGAEEAAGEARERIDHLEVAIFDTPGPSSDLADRVRGLETDLEDLLLVLEGDRTVSSRQEPTPMGLSGRAAALVGDSWPSSTSAPTGNHRRSYEIAAGELDALLADLAALDATLTGLERDAEAAGAPWTPGRVPTWSPE